MLKKKQNLNDLEQRLCDRIDDVIRVLKATCADKNETTRKWRLIENRLESTLEIIVMQIFEDPEEIRSVVTGIVKNSKKLKNPNVLVSHIKSNLEAIQRINRPDYESHYAITTEHLDPRYNPPARTLTSPVAAIRH